MAQPLGQIGMRSESSPTQNKTNYQKKKEGIKMDIKFMRAEEVAEVLEVSTSFAYKVIRQLNNEVVS